MRATWNISLSSCARMGLLILITSVLAIAQTRDDVYGLLRTGYDALQRQDWESAREASLKATAIDPKNQYGWSYLARAYDMLGDFAKAEGAFKILIAINPKHATAYNSLGVLYKKMGRTDEAIASYRKQYEVTPRSRFASWNLGRAIATRGEWEEAQRLAAVAVEIVPDEVNRWLFLGRTQVKNGHGTEARTSFERALALPHDAMLENNIAWEMADAGIDLETSWKLVSGAIETTARQACEPETLSDGDRCTAELRQLALMLDTAGWVRYRQGNSADAEPYLQSAYAISPSAEHATHLAAVFAKRGRIEDSANLLAQARTRQNFEQLLDVREVMSEVAKLAGGVAKLSALLDRAPLGQPATAFRAKALALVDARGNVKEVQAMAQESGVTEAAKSMALPPLSWPGFAFTSIRSIEFQRVGDEWLPWQSYVGTLPPPPPCAPAPKPGPRILTEDTTSPTISKGCLAAF